MAGVKSRSGRKRFPLELHIARNTYRRDRHGPLPTLGAVALQPAIPEPPAAALVGLGPQGQEFMRASFTDYEFSVMETEVLRLAGRCRDDEAQAREAGDLKSARAAARQFLAALQRLGLPREDSK